MKGIGRGLVPVNSEEVGSFPAGIEAPALAASQVLPRGSAGNRRPRAGMIVECSRLSQFSRWTKAQEWIEIVRLSSSARGMSAW